MWSFVVASRRRPSSGPLLLGMRTCVVPSSSSGFPAGWGRRLVGVRAAGRPATAGDSGQVEGELAGEEGEYVGSLLDLLGGGLALAVAGRCLDAQQDRMTGSARRSRLQASRPLASMERVGPAVFLAGRSARCQTAVPVDALVARLGGLTAG